MDLWNINNPTLASELIFGSRDPLFKENKIVKKDHPSKYHNGRKYISYKEDYSFHDLFYGVDSYVKEPHEAELGSLSFEPKLILRTFVFDTPLVSTDDNNFRKKVEVIHHYDLLEEFLIESKIDFLVCINRNFQSTLALFSQYDFSHRTYYLRENILENGDSAIDLWMRMNSDLVIDKSVSDTNFFIDNRF